MTSEAGEGGWTGFKAVVDEPNNSRSSEASSLDKLTSALIPRLHFVGNSLRLAIQNASPLLSFAYNRKPPFSSSSRPLKPTTKTVIMATGNPTPHNIPSSPAPVGTPPLRTIIDDKSPHCIPFILSRLHEYLQDPSKPNRPFIIGLNGVQGAGKTTLVSKLAETLLEKEGLETLVLSIDDLYLPREAQIKLATENAENKLVQYRGEPGLSIYREKGTHDMILARQVIASLLSNKETKIPSYDKALHQGLGDRAPPSSWHTVNGPGSPPIRVIILEGWCIGFRSLPPATVASKREAPSLTLKDHKLDDLLFVNEKLIEYDVLTDEYNAFIHIDAEDTRWVYEWREQQEAELRRVKGTGMSMEQSCPGFTAGFGKDNRGTGGSIGFKFPNHANNTPQPHRSTPLLLRLSSSPPDLSRWEENQIVSVFISPIAPPHRPESSSSPTVCLLLTRTDAPTSIWNSARIKTLISEHFERGSKLNDQSNRYQYTCRNCGVFFAKGRCDALMAHLIRKCPNLPQHVRDTAILAQNGLPNDGTYTIQGPPNRPIVPAQNGFSLSALEVLAEVSKNFEQPHNQAGGNPAHVSSNHLKLQEQYTLDNPPVSYEQRASREKKILEQQRREQQMMIEAAKARAFNTSLHNGHSPGMDVPPHSINQHPPSFGSSSGLPSHTHSMYNPASRSSSPNIAMAAKATSMAQLASASFSPNMLDPELVNHEPPMTSHIPITSGEREFVQAIQEANASMPDSFVHHPSGDAASPWREGSVHNTFQEQQVRESIEPVQQLRFQSPQVPSVESMTTEFSAEPGDGKRNSNKKSQKSRSKFSHSRRLAVQSIRKLGACTRCRFLKKCCGEGTPCQTCKDVDCARVWKSECSRKRLPAEMGMFAAGMHQHLMTNNLKAAMDQSKFQPCAVEIDASLHPETQIFASFKVLEGQATVDANMDPAMGEGFENQTVYILDQDNDDLGAKMDVYTRQMQPYFFQHEPSEFMRTTLDTVVNLTSTNTLHRETLNKALELWGTVHILVDHEVRWNLTSRFGGQNPVGGGEVIDGRSWRLVNSQLGSVVERKAAQLTKEVLASIEKHLLGQGFRQSFEIFLTGILILNCLEKCTWFFNFWEQENLLKDWPLTQPPFQFATQAEDVTNMLNMLLHLKNVTPVVTFTPDGVIHTDISEVHRNFFRKLYVTEEQVSRARNQPQFDPVNSRCYELRYLGRLLLNEPGDEGKSP
ncbi:hypothetical protein HYFRA_00001218 [Hymenoscyphus fraxineus]|uniref:SRP54-type proteins GTP-binding domain-containing protein n=1 Tax=Hymenoscyphus fraxineus TaxID=746836 RepID=A0A9N9KST7_9HELO|nr:hypothetical protein HYFRA_00001218 [Hymenoscyphus fraxineus]